MGFLDDISDRIDEVKDEAEERTGIDIRPLRNDFL
jgi:hypothetical protein